MKAISIIIFLCFSTLVCYSQNAIKDTTIAFSSELIRLNYTPSDLFSSISIATHNLVDGRKGIQFYFISKPRQKQPSIRIDSIILISSSDDKFIANNSFKDTTYYLNNGGLSLATIHLLNKTQLEILRQETIRTIILTVDTKPITIRIKRNSQKKLKEMVNTYL